MDQSNYKKASFCYLIGNFFNKGLAFLTIPIFTRLLSTSDYGLINTYSSWGGIIIMFMGLSLQMGIRTAFIDYYNNVKDYVSTIIKFTTFFSLIFTVLIVSVVKLFNINIPISLVIMCLVNSYSCAIIEDISTYYMMEFKYIKRTVLMIVPNLLSVITAIIIIRFALKDNLYYGKIVP